MPFVPAKLWNPPGESLEDLLRKATAKTLDQPDEVANAQVGTAHGQVNMACDVAI
jgi:hypothetical protein